MDPSTVTGRINATALALLEEHPDGLRWSKTEREDRGVGSDFHPKTVNGCVWKLVEKFPGQVYKPSKGCSVSGSTKGSWKGSSRRAGGSRQRASSPTGSSRSTPCQELATRRSCLFLVAADLAYERSRGGCGSRRRPGRRRKRGYLQPLDCCKGRPRQTVGADSSTTPLIAGRMRGPAARTPVPPIEAPMSTIRCASPTQLGRRRDHVEVGIRCSSHPSTSRSRACRRRGVR